MLALCAGCDPAPADRGVPAFDRQPPGSENRSPFLSGTPGTLRYRPGCLYLDDGNGGETGLVVPSYASFDGERLTGRLRTPDGKQIARTIGQRVTVTGQVVDNPRDGRYSCDTGKVLVADAF